MTERRTSGKGRAKSATERRTQDRRESPRVPMTFLVRDIKEGGSYEQREGDLSTGGIWWEGRYPPLGRKVELRFRIPGVVKEVTAEGEIIKLTDSGRDLGFHVRFTQLDVDSELAIARYIDGHSRRPF
jgi:hypothetical protein